MARTKKKSIHYVDNAKFLEAMKDETVDALQKDVYAATLALQYKKVLGCD